MIQVNMELILNEEKHYYPKLSKNMKYGLDANTYLAKN